MSSILLWTVDCSFTIFLYISAILGNWYQQTNICFFTIIRFSLLSRIKWPDWIPKRVLWFRSVKANSDLCIFHWFVCSSRSRLYSFQLIKYQSPIKSTFVLVVYEIAIFAYFKCFIPLFTKFTFFSFFGLVGRVFANGAGDWGSIPGRVIPKTFKMVLDTSLLNTQHNKVRIKGKFEQSRGGSSALSTPRCSSNWIGSLLVALD